MTPYIDTGGGDWGGKIPPPQLWKIATGGPRGEKETRGEEREKEKGRKRKKGKEGKKKRKREREEKEEKRVNKRYF